MSFSLACVILAGSEQTASINFFCSPGLLQCIVLSQFICDHFRCNWELKHHYHLTLYISSHKYEMSYTSLLFYLELFFNFLFSLDKVPRLFKIARAYPAAKFLVPDWGYIVGVYSRLWHRIVVPARQAAQAGRPAQKPYPKIDYILQSGTKN
jgi:hypothetical protein